MKQAVSKWILALATTAFFANAAVAESVQEAQLKLLQLEKQSLTQTTDLSALERSLVEVAKERDAANAELSDKKADLIQVSQKMQDAIAKHYAEPTPDNERIAQDLSRSFSLSEKMVSRRQLEVERAQRKYEDVEAQLTAAKSEQAKTVAALDAQKSRVERLKSDATALATAQAREAKAQKDLIAQQSAEAEAAQLAQEKAAQEKATAEQANKLAAEKAAAEKVAAEKTAAAKAKAEPTPTVMADIDPALTQNAKPQAAAAKAEQPTPEQAEETPSLEEQMDAINRASDSNFSTGW